MKFKTLISILLAFAQLSWAQLHPYKQHNKWGYANSTGDIKIPCIYTSAEDFTGSIATVGRDRKIGAIDSLGQVTIPFLYDELYLYQYNGGIAISRRGDKWSLVDKKGRQISKYKYDFWETFQWDHAAVCKNEKWGLIDTNGNEVIACRYDMVFSFSDGLACVKQNGQWGYVNSKGSVILPFIYDQASIFYNGIAMVRMNGNSYLINKKGEIVTKGKYNNIELSTIGIAIVMQDTLKGIIDKTGTEIIKCKYNNIRLIDSGIIEVKESNIYKLLNLKGEEISNEHFDDIQRHYYSIIARKNGKYGIVTKYWETIAPFIYDSVIVLSERAFITLKSGKWSLHDTSGKLLTAITYDKIEQVNSAYDRCHIGYLVKVDGKTGALDANGKEIIPCIYNSIERTLDPDIVIIEMAYKYGYISAQGKILLPCIYERVTDVNDGIGFGFKDKKWTMVNSFGCVHQLPYTNVNAFNNWLCSVEINGKYGYIDTTGKEVIPAVYDNAGNFDDNITWVQLNNKEGLIDRTGRMIFPAIYDAIGSFDKEYASVKNKGKWGIVTISGRLIVPFEYDEIEVADRGQVLPAIAKNKDKYGLINVKGELTPPCIYDEISGNGVRKDSLWAYIDSKGIIRSKFLYQQAPNEQEQRSPVSRNNKYGYLDNNGKEVVPCIYDDAEDFKNGRALVKKDGHFLIINRNGKVIDESPIVFECKGSGLH